MVQRPLWHCLPRRERRAAGPEGHGTGDLCADTTGGPLCEVDGDGATSSGDLEVVCEEANGTVVNAEQGCLRVSRVAGDNLCSVQFKTKVSNDEGEEMLIAVFHV